MKSNIIRRLEIIEKQASHNRIANADRVIIISYPDDDEVERNRLERKRLVELRKKYGPNISEDDFLIVGIRKFYRKENKGGYLE